MISTDLWLQANTYPDAGPVGTFRTPVTFHPSTAAFRVHRSFQRHVHTHAMAHGGSVQFSLHGMHLQTVRAGSVPVRANTETTCVLLRFPECVVLGCVLLLLAPDRVRMHLSHDLGELAAAARVSVSPLHQAPNKV